MRSSSSSKLGWHPFSDNSALQRELGHRLSRHQFHACHPVKCAPVQSSVHVTVRDTSAVKDMSSSDHVSLDCCLLCFYCTYYGFTAHSMFYCTYYVFTAHTSNAQYVSAISPGTSAIISVYYYTPCKQGLLIVVYCNVSNTSTTCADTCAVQRKSHLNRQVQLMCVWASQRAPPKKSCHRSFRHKIERRPWYLAPSINSVA